MKIELFDSENETWQIIGKLKKPRLYHGTAILLPDGSVLAAGSTGHDFTRAIFNPKQHFEQEIETIKPPYMTSDTRPQITNYVDSMQYDTPYEITTDSDISKVSLVRMSSTTHNNNMDQRCLFLNIFENSGTTIKIQSPKDGSWAPPGYYMLFVIDNSGIPSIGKFVKIGSNL